MEKRKTLGLSQRALAQQMDVIFSLIGKVETGDRRLDVIEFVAYCEALELEPAEVINQLKQYRSSLEKSQ